MSNSKHHHHHHRKDGATRFKERSLNAIAFRRSFEKWLKRALVILTIIMLIVTFLVYTIG
jgi:preprotein translocase subunit SecG